jgi:hypothetical protein
MRIEEFRERAQALTLVLVNAKAEAIAIGLYKTGHSIEEPVTKIGYEIAEVLEGKHVTKPTTTGFWGREVPLQKK